VTSSLDETHAPALRSWVETANDPENDFPIQNLPFGIFRRAGTSNPGRVGIAIGDQIVDIAACADAGLFAGGASAASARCRSPSLNDLMAAGRPAAHALRRAVSALLRADAPAAKRSAVERALVAMRDAEMLLPAMVGDYTDFYASIAHATNIGRMLRPDSPLLPNYKWVPIGYHGRASSLVPSGTAIARPCGQFREAGDTSRPPSFGPTRRLDYELEVGAFIGPGNSLGSPIPIAEAEQHLFGLCLVNDWSARDVQTWEYQPLGPFLAKSFATTVSPWVVTLDALAPYRARAYPRPADDPAPLPYLFSQENTSAGGFDITLEVLITTSRMRETRHEPMRRHRPMRVSVGQFADMYWTFAQLVTHHASNGCNLRPGDLLASGTVSGFTEESRGCLLERTWRGTQPLELPSGEARSFLEDGDEVILRGYCERSGHPRIGFGECRGRVLPAVA
jgi:fumarylacetoacetase